MIGNMSNCTTIQEALKEWSGKEINFGLINPKTCVSEGAAIKAHVLDGGETVKILEKQDNHAADFEQTEEIKKEIEEEQSTGKRIEKKFDKEIKSVISASIGILAKKRDGTPFVYKLLKKNMAYPVDKKQLFKVPTDKAEKQTITVYEGESENSEECNLLGSVELKLDGKLNYGEPIEVTLSKDKNGILQVEAIHQQSGLHIKSEIKRENGLTEKDVITSTNEMEELWLA
jgi:molecular chaperone DnaK (HSP70)